MTLERNAIAVTAKKSKTLAIQMYELNEAGPVTAFYHMNTAT